MPCSERRRATALPGALTLVLGAAALAGCARHTPAPAPVPPAAPPPRAWPQGHTPPLKITDSLVLEIPLQYERSALDADTGAPPAAPRWFAHQEAGFDFFLPDFSGYTLENYRAEDDPRKVEVVYLHSGDPHEAEPGAAGAWPPNMLKRSLGELLDPKVARQLYGLTCYAERQRPDHMACYGERDPARHEDLMLYAPVPPYPAELAFPALQVRYYTPRYGGVRIAWRTHVDNLPRWREIDARIWKFIEAWNVAPAAERAAPQGTAPHEGAAPAARPGAGSGGSSR